jgi:large subunit ribosomal protein L22
MEVIAKARFVRMSPRKVRLVADLVRGLDVDRAEAQLSFVRKAAARPILKVIRSAAANAEHNFKLEAHDLYVKTITVDGGPTLKRWRARAFGRAAGIKKRTSHITVALAQRGVAGTPMEAAEAVVASKTAKAEAGAKAKPAAKKPAAKRASKPAAKPKAKKA